MNSDIQLETAAIFFLSNFYLKQCISRVYIIVDFIWMSLLELQGTRSEKLQNEKFLLTRDSNSRPLDCKATNITIRPWDLIYIIIYYW